MLNDFGELFYQLLVYLVQVVIVSFPGFLMFLAIAAGIFIGTRVTTRLLDEGIDAIIRRRRFKKIGDNLTRGETLHRVSTLTPREFEYYVADLLKKQGYQAKVVGRHGSGDGGIDIIAKDENQTLYVQCKKFIGRDIGVAMVRLPTLYTRAVVVAFL